MEKKRKKITLLAIQMGSVIGKINDNIEKVRILLDKNLRQKSADFVFLPEVWTCGWDCSSFIDSAESINNSKAIALLQNLAKKYSVNIIGGSMILKFDDGIYYNTTPVINKNGDLVCTYQKNHLYSYYGCNEGEFVSGGQTPIMVCLDGIKLGLTICYDIRFPEIYRAYRKAGADVLVNLAAWGATKKIPWDTMTTSRAVENQCYFVALTQTGELKNGDKNLGHSMIIDYKGDILNEINQVEGAIYADIDIDEMYDFRDKCRVLEDLKDNYEVVII